MELAEVVEPLGWTSLAKSGTKTQGRVENWANQFKHHSARGGNHLCLSHIEQYDSIVESSFSMENYDPSYIKFNIRIQNLDVHVHNMEA